MSTTSLLRFSLSPQTSPLHHRYEFLPLHHRHEFLPLHYRRRRSLQSHSPKIRTVSSPIFSKAVEFKSPSRFRELEKTDEEDLQSTVLLDVTGMMCGACVTRVKSILSTDERVDSVVVNMLTETAAIKLKEKVGLDFAGVGEELAKRVTASGFDARRRVSGMGVEAKVRKWRETVEKKEELLVKSRNRVAFAWTLVALCCGSHASHILHSVGIHIGHGSILDVLHNSYVKGGLALGSLLGPGRDLLFDGLRALRKGSPNMNSLVGFGSIAAFAISSVSLLNPDLQWNAAFFDEPVMLLGFILLGRSLEERARIKASSDMNELLSLISTKSRLVITPSGSDVFADSVLCSDAMSIEVPTDDIRVGDSVLVLPGETIPVDDLSSGKRIGNAREQEGLYYFDEGTDEIKQVHVVNWEPSSRQNQVMLRHFRLGHPSFAYLKHLFPSLFKNNDIFQCEICQLAKHQRSVFKPKPYKATRPFAMIHSDIWGPSRSHNIYSKRWFITFIDDHTRVCWLYLLKDKSDAQQTFINFHNMVKTQYSTNIQILHTDNGKEYFNQILGGYLNTSGIVHQSSCTNTPQQNGIAERKNKHLLEVARSIMFTTNTHKQFWGDAVLTACYLINRMPTNVLQFQTPLNVLSKCFPENRTISNLPLKVFGCTVFVHNHETNRNKLDPKAFKCIFLGYAANQKGYKCYSPEKKKIIVTMDLTFFENTPFSTKNSLQGGNDSEGNSWNFFPEILTSEANPSHFENLSLPRVENLDHENTKQGENLDVNNNQDENKVPDLNVQQQESQLNTELRVYSRRKNQQTPLTLETCHDSNTDSGNSLVLSPIDNSNDLPIAVRKGVRSCTQHPIARFVQYDQLSSSMRAFVSSLEETEIPKTVEEAFQRIEWKKAVEEEMQALEKNGTWEVVKKPRDVAPVGCKWVFTVKYKSDGSIERHKARLVAKGFTQTYGLDYQETFAPVAKLNTIRVLLSLAANLDWPLHQLDIKNAFLNGDLTEEIYMELPPGFKSARQIGQVCKLKKSLYGLKQSPRAWFEKFSKVVRQQGYKQAHTDHTLFYKHEGGKSTILIVYVDDIILTGDNVSEMNRLKRKLAHEFEIKDLGMLRYFLGMEIARNRSGISVSQRKYVLDLLKETGLLGCKPVDTPADPKVKLGDQNTSTPVDKGRYQRLVGKLIYLAHTRPDIAFAVSMVSQFMHAPYEEHLNAVIRILRYLKGSPGKGLFFKKGESREIEAYTDADWAGSMIDMRSTSGYCSYVWGNLVTWRSKKQNVVARSSAEAELRSLANGVSELIWLKLLLEELQVAKKSPMRLYCDNQAAIDMAHNPVHHDRTKHVEIDRHFIKEKIEAGTICIPHVASAEQTADILTKGLPRPTFEKMIDKLGLFDLYNPT